MNRNASTTSMDLLDTLTAPTDLAWDTENVVKVFSVLEESAEQCLLQVALKSLSHLIFRP